MASMDSENSTVNSVSMYVGVQPCGICKKAGRRMKEAKRFCEDCNEYICNECTDTHLALRSSRKHKIAISKMIPKDPPATVAVHSGVDRSIGGSDFRSRKILNMTIQSSNLINTRLVNDHMSPNITGCVFMPNGELVICDRLNLKTKLLDSSWTVKSYVPHVGDGPWDVSIVDDYNIIVTLPSIRQLQCIQVYPEMKTGRIIQLQIKCWGINVLDKEIYVTCHNMQDNDGEVNVLDLRGNILRKICVNKDMSFMFDTPYYITISETSRKMYVSAAGLSTLYCMTLDGNVVYTCNDLGHIHGVYADRDDNAIVCCWRPSQVQSVSANGKNLGTAVSFSGIGLPYCIGFRSSDNILVFGSSGEKQVLVFKLQKSPRKLETAV